MNIILQEGYIEIMHANCKHVCNVTIKFTEDDAFISTIASIHVQFSRNFTRIVRIFHFSQKTLEYDPRHGRHPNSKTQRRKWTLLTERRSNTCQSGIRVILFWEIAKKYKVEISRVRSFGQLHVDQRLDPFRKNDVAHSPTYTIVCNGAKGAQCAT